MKKKLCLLLYVILFFVVKRRILDMDAKKTGLIIPMHSFLAITTFFMTKLNTRVRPDV